MAPAAAGDLPPVPVDQHEIVGAQHLAEPDPVALHPEPAPARIAQRQMTERHVAVAFHLENPAGARSLRELLAGRRVHVDHRILSSSGRRSDCWLPLPMDELAAQQKQGRSSTKPQTPITRIAA